MIAPAGFARIFASSSAARASPVTAPRAQALTAALYGYPSWAALLADLGPDFALDDVDVGPLEIYLRHRRALAVILAVLPSLPSAGRVLAALDPTAASRPRRSRSVLTALAHPAAFHPVRLRALVEETDAVRDGIEDSEDANLPRETLAEAALALVTSSCAAEDLTPLPYDAYALLQRRLLALHAAPGATTSLLPSSTPNSVALAMASRPIPPSASRWTITSISGIPLSLAVSRSRHRGCYLRSCPDGDIAVAAVLSPPVAGVDREGVDAATTLLGHCRGHTMSLSDILDGGLPVCPSRLWRSLRHRLVRRPRTSPPTPPASMRSGARPCVRSRLRRSTPSSGRALVLPAPSRSAPAAPRPPPTGGPDSRVHPHCGRDRIPSGCPSGRAGLLADRRCGDLVAPVRLRRHAGVRRHGQPDAVYEYARLVAPDRATFLALPSSSRRMS